MTPLMIASRYGYITIVSLLLEHDCDLHLTDNFGFTALHYAAACGHYKIVDLLLRMGADPSVTSVDGSAPLDFSVAQRHERITALLQRYAGKRSLSDTDKLKAWLTAIECEAYVDKFLRAGYDFEFIAKEGLEDADLDCVGVPLSSLGLRRKLKKLFRIQEFAGENEDDEEDDEEDEEDEDEDEDSDEE